MYGCAGVWVCADARVDGTALTDAVAVTASGWLGEGVEGCGGSGTGVGMEWGVWVILWLMGYLSVV